MPQTKQSMGQKIRTLFRFPDVVDKRIRVLSQLSLLSQIVIIGTGGAVRLTGSGLGCSTYPMCTPDSWVPTPEMGIHGIIEFGNRLLTFVLIIIAVLQLLAVYKLRHDRKALFRIALLLLLGIPAQGLIGGITVLSGLNPYVVGLHFFASTILVILATIQLDMVNRGEQIKRQLQPSWLRLTVWLSAITTIVTVIIGIVATGSGPHAGDDRVLRNGLDPELMHRIHSYPAYATLALILIILAAAIAYKHRELAKYIFWSLAVLVLQMLLGIAQARLGLPEILVGAHMIIAAILVALVTMNVLRLKQAVLV